VVAIGAGDGTATDLVQLTGSLPSGARLYFGDLDGDGQDDLVMENRLRVAWAKGLGSGSFGPRVDIASLSLTANAGRTTLIDVDRDGMVDILFDQAPPSFPRTLHWIRSEGGGAFASPASLGTLSPISRRGSAVDLDLDGDQDLMLETLDPATELTYHENLGPGLFGPAVILPFSGGYRGNLAFPLDVDGDGDLELLATASSPLVTLGDQLEFFDNATLGSVGTSYCDSFVPNSTGVIGGLSAYGSTQLSLNRLGLTASNLPTYAFGFFITSQTQGFTFGTPGVVGPLCLGGEIGRFVRPGEIQQSDGSGTFALDLDLTDFPQPAGGVAVQAGETWNFQAWHRDLLGSMPVSNFTIPVSVTF
jgi:hypothetical protein